MCSDEFCLRDVPPLPLRFSSSLRTAWQPGGNSSSRWEAPVTRSFQVIEDHGDVVRSIEESCGRSDDFPRVCEELMQAHAGINLKGFSDLLSHCATEEAVIATSCRGDGDAMIASAFRLVKLRAAVGRVAEVPHAKWLAKHGDLDGDTGEIQRVVDQALRGLSEGWEGGVEAGALLASLVDAE